MKAMIVTEQQNETATMDTVRLFDVSDRTQIRITGSDRARFLHNFTSNDIKQLKPGHGCETFITNIKGKVVAHVFVFCTDEALWLDGSPGQEPVLLSHLGKYILIDDVQLVSMKGTLAELFVTGQFAAQLLQLDSPMSVGDHVVRGEGTDAFSVRRVDLFGEPGFLMSVPVNQVERIKSGFRLLGIQEGTPTEFEARRIVAGFPNFGIDISDDNLAQEVARTKQCVSFDKGCYLGQETIARLDSMGHTNRELRRLSFNSTEVPARGATIFDETGGAEVGLITSSTSLTEIDASRTSEVAALGLVKRVAMAPGTVVCVKSGETALQGVVL